MLPRRDTAPSRLRRGVPLILVGVLALTGLAACGGSGGDHRAGGSGDHASDPGSILPPTLQPRWNATGAAAHAAPSAVVGDLGGVSSAISDRLSVTRLEGGLSALNLTTGHRAWFLAPPRRLRNGSFCQISPQISSTGYVGVLLSGRGHPCTIAGAVDVRTGRLAWTHETPRRSSYDQGSSVAVSAHALIATVFCDEVDRYRLRDGHFLSTIGRADRKCNNSAATDGVVISTLHDPETAQTPDDHGTGFVPAVDAPGAFELYDADSGRRLWSRPLSTTLGADTTEVLSHRPLIVTYEEHDVFASRIVRAGGRPGPYLGRTLGYNEHTVVYGQGDGVIVLGYPDGADPGLAFGYSTRTGRELWHVDLAGPDQSSSGSTAGIGDATVVGDRLVVARPVEEPTHPEADQPSYIQGSPAVWVTSASLTDPDDVQTLGRVPGTTALLRGRLLLAGDVAGTTLAAYRLPTSGVDRSYVYPTPQQLGETASRWTSQDLRAADVALACDGVGDSTLAVLGIVQRALPRSSDCQWSDGVVGQPQSLDVYVQESPPGVDAELDPTPSSAPSSTPGAGATLDPAETAARHAALELVHPDDDLNDGRHGPVQKVPGVGDEAWVFGGSDLADVETSVVVRYRNVVLRVTAAEDDEFTYPAGRVPPDQVEEAALQAAADVVRRLGGTATVPAAPTGPASTVTSVPDPCRVLTTSAAVLVPGGRADGTGSAVPARQTACEWDTSEDADGDGHYTGATLDAAFYAAAGSPLGASPADNARRFRSLVAGRHRVHLPGLGGATYLYVDVDADASDSSHYHDVQLTNVSGNLVTVVDYTVWQNPPSIEAMTQNVRRAMVRLVGAARR